MSVPSAGSILLAEMERRGWTQRELAAIISRPAQVVNEIVKGKRAITVETACELAAAFGNSPEDWLLHDMRFHVANAGVDTLNVRRRARVFEIAPVKEMERRGWIPQTDSVDDLAKEVGTFFGIDSVDEEPSNGFSTRKSDLNAPLTPAQRAWCFRVKKLAENIPVSAFDESQLIDCKAALRKLATSPELTANVPGVLAEFGIRFVVVEPLQGIKVDGVAFRLDGIHPVIGMSVRYDRVDSFWFTLCHELSHIQHNDDAPLDSDLTDRMEGVEMVKSEIERRANDEAADLLIPKAELTSFIRRVGPLYSKDKIAKFANRIRIHPGIVVGQLQRKDEIGWNANREMLRKVREHVVSKAITDGWGVSGSEK